jgi:hypothetical protein
MLIGRDYKGKRLVAVTNAAFGYWLYRRGLADIIRIGQVVCYRVW